MLLDIPSTILQLLGIFLLYFKVLYSLGCTILKYGLVDGEYDEVWHTWIREHIYLFVAMFLTYILLKIHDENFVALFVDGGFLQTTSNFWRPLDPRVIVYFSRAHY